MKIWNGLELLNCPPKLQNMKIKENPNNKCITFCSNIRVEFMGPFSSWQNRLAFSFQISAPYQQQKGLMNQKPLVTFIDTKRRRLSDLQCYTIWQEVIKQEGLACCRKWVWQNTLLLWPSPERNNLLHREIHLVSY